MKTKEERLKKHGTVIRADGGDPLLQYSPKDRVFFMETCGRYLRHPFGYDYSRFRRWLRLGGALQFVGVGVAARRRFDGTSLFNEKPGFCGRAT